MTKYNVSTISPEEAANELARLRSGRASIPQAHRTAVLQGGIVLKGSFELIAREASTGEVAWKHAAENLITDFGRRGWMDMRFYNMQLGFAASTEAPVPSRASIAGDINQIFISGNITPSNNVVTNTKTLSTTFGTPASNRTLGTIFLTRFNEGVNPGGYARGILAYALLTPPKTQTTTQTLEVVYKISMTPIS